MGSPYFDLEPEDPNSRFLNLFNRFEDQYPDIGQYIKPDDPELLEYQRLAGMPSGSDELISSYVEGRPTREDYSPSTGRRIAAFLLGTLSGRGAEGAREIVEQPYSQALEDWKLEGTGLTSRARMADVERNRQLQALKFGLTTKASQGRARSVDERSRLQEARRIAGEVEKEEERKLRAEENQNQRDIINSMSREVFEQRKSMDEWRKAEALRDNTRMEEAAKERSERLAAEAASFDAINKKLSSYASQQGIQTSIMDERGRKTEMTARDIADEIAYKKAKANPAFADLLEETDEGWKFAEPKYGKDRIRILKNYLNSLSSKYLRGEF